MSGGGSNTTTTTAKADPWSESVPYLRQVMSEAKGLYGSGQGFNPFPGSTVVPFAPQTQEAMGSIEAMSRGGDPFGAAARSQAMGVLGSGGMSPWQSSALAGTHGIATGANSIGTEGDYRSLLGRAGNPYYEGLVDKEAGKLATDVSREVDMMGRRGSGFHVNELTDRIGDFRERALANNYNQTIANERGLIGDIGGVQGQNLTNMMAAGQGIFGAGDTASGRAAQYAGMAPGMYQSQFAPAERLASVGAQYENLAGRELENAIRLYEGNQQAPWSRLQNYSALVGGTGSMGGSSTTSAQTPPNYAAPLGGAISGAQMGSMFGPWGMGIGGLLGGGLGLLGSGIF